HRALRLRPLPDRQPVRPARGVRARRGLRRPVRARRRPPVRRGRLAGVAGPAGRRAGRVRAGRAGPPRGAARWPARGPGPAGRRQPARPHAGTLTALTARPASSSPSPPPAPERLRADVDATRLWYHTLELPGGVVTPGWFDLRPIVGRLPWPEVRGARCLDVG